MAADTAHTPAFIVSAWQDQQQAFIEQRDLRTTTMLETVARHAATLGRPPRILDLACGPGYLSTAAAERFPDAVIVGVDRDPVLLKLAADTNPEPDRITYVDGDLTADDLAELLPHRPFDAVISTTALHWLDPDHLVGLYVRLAALMAPGAVLLNGDHLLFNPISQPFLSGVCEQLRNEHLAAATAAGAMTWSDWWTAAESLPGYEQAAQLRKQRWRDKHATLPVSAEFHLEALRAAGFTELGTIFQWFDDRIIFGRKPTGPDTPGDSDGPGSGH
ncbi:class I SAM-dependent methyltransferase [Corynebacterium mendelii]|uniref:Class I SAM-dependent methyltransferase n=1 Tax=Corynebacterium mendelii TaxID=2765362 RepID=A0A939E2V9_9CORY|nr:class I SAM-dependent methyltransferase [Corynebacterium mendelii]